jgi:trehalose 6-phosphate phosphatase
MPYRSRLPHLFDHWEEFSRRVHDTNQIQLLLDFDGTLANFRVRPEQVRLSANARRALTRLVRHRSLRVAIVSGRRRAALRRQVQVPRVKLLGLYGWENKEGCHLPPKTAGMLSQVHAALADLPNTVPGIRLEDKGISLAVHFRGAWPQARRRAQARIRKSLTRWRGHLHIIRSHDVWDVAPRQVRGKGVAIHQALGSIRKTHLLIYLGDDLTDEPAFALLRNGIAVLVGPVRRTNARFRLRNPDEVCLFLKRLEAELS